MNLNPMTWDAPKWIVFVALFCIVSPRATATYAIGRGLVAGAARTRFAARMQGPGYQRATQLVARYGAPVVSLSFLTVGLQSAVLLAAGGLKMPWRRFIPGLIVGSMLWALLYGTVGFVGFELWTALYRFSPTLAVGGTVLVVAGLIGFIMWRRRTDSGSDPLPAAPEQAAHGPGMVGEASVQPGSDSVAR